MMCPPIAMCPRCVVPLVMTMGWSHAEFYCLNCGAHLGFLSPVPADETPRLLEQMHATGAEFERLGGKDLITAGGYRTGCSQCIIALGESHDRHATDDERARHEAALTALDKRIRAGR